jgi:hypothetical protein
MHDALAGERGRNGVIGFDPLRPGSGTAPVTVARLAAARSRTVMTASTPGSFAAAAESMPRMVAWAWGERTNTPAATRSGRRSSL